MRLQTARYWMTEEQTKKKIQMPCRTCGETGHDQVDCTHSKVRWTVRSEHRYVDALLLSSQCSKCGALDEHDAYRCPVFVTCHRCGIKGHISQVTIAYNEILLTFVLTGDCMLIGLQESSQARLLRTLWLQRPFELGRSVRASPRLELNLCTQNCHTIWRQYSYRSSDSREAAIDARKLLKGRPLLDGGEGYVGQSIWCFTCGDQGHWGLVSPFLRWP